MDKQPSSYFCFICGRKNPVGLKMYFYSSGPGEVTAEYTVSESYQGYPGVVHGGITAAMLDETAGRTVISNGDDQFFITLKLDIKYRQQVPTETPLKIIGRLTSMRGRRATAHSEIQLSDGAVAAEAEALLAVMPPEGLDSVDHEELGWRVYDD